MKYIPVSSPFDYDNRSLYLLAVWTPTPVGIRPACEQVWVPLAPRWDPVGGLHPRLHRHTVSRINSFSIILITLSLSLRLLI